VIVFYNESQTSLPKWIENGLIKADFCHQIKAC
jgi:hypothetical protein